MSSKSGKLKHGTWGFLVADTARLLRRAFEKQMSGFAISFGEARALYYVSRYPGLRQVDLAELLEIQPIRLARQIDRLEKLNYVRRKAVPGDKRAYHVVLCPASKPVLARFEMAASSIRTKAASGLNVQQISALESALTLIHENLYDD